MDYYLDNTEAVQYWEQLGYGVSPQTQIAMLVEQNAMLQQQIAALSEQVATLAAKRSKASANVASKDEQSISKAKKALPAKSNKAKQRIAESKDIAARDTEKTAAIDMRAMKLAQSLTKELEGIAQADIYKVILAYQDGIGRSNIHTSLKWGTSKHTRIVKPVLDALEAMETKETQ